MHPAISIIVFTVTTGLAYGWLALGISLDLLGIGHWQHDAAFLWTAALAVVLLVVGLVSSTFHLANKRNAWRAFMRVRTSWLSREAVLAVVFFPLFGAYGFCLVGDMPRAAVALGWLSVGVALATVFATGMIYACLRTIRAWHTPWVPANYLLMALALGGLALHAQRELTAAGGASGISAVVFGLLVLAFAGKVVYWFKVGLPDAVGIDAATGFRMATVRLLDVGHGRGTFLEREFDYHVSRPMLLLLKASVLIIGFVAPAALIAKGAGSAAAVIALLLGYAGAMVERWLFFADAEHVVRLYHGQRSV